MPGRGNETQYFHFNVMSDEENASGVSDHFWELQWSVQVVQGS